MILLVDIAGKEGVAVAPASQLADVAAAPSSWLRPVPTADYIKANLRDPASHLQSLPPPPLLPVTPSTVAPRETVYTHAPSDDNLSIRIVGGNGVRRCCPYWSVCCLR